MLVGVAPDADVGTVGVMVAVMLDGEDCGEGVNVLDV